jgi:hypothetical protein
MSFSKDTLRKVRELMQKHQSSLWADLGDAPDSPISLIYRHNLINEPGSLGSPASAREALRQQVEAATTLSSQAELLLETFKGLLEKQNSDVLASVEGLISQANQSKMANSDPTLADLFSEGILSSIKQKLKDLTGDVFQDWDRIVNTEVSNALGLGALERILRDIGDKPAFDTYVYRINPNDGRTCPECQKFYIDSDSSPKLYRLSTILAYGSNYGKPRKAWNPVAGATHPNCRDSALLELKPGWRLLPGGSVTYIGVPSWEAYVGEKLEA